MTISTLDSISDAAWRPWAACADLGPAPFYGRPSKSLCAACPTSEPCLWATFRDHEENKEALAGPRLFIRYAEWRYTPTTWGPAHDAPRRAGARAVQHHQALHRISVPRAG